MTSSTLPDAVDASTLSPGSYGSTWGLSGEFSRVLLFERSQAHSDLFHSFFGPVPAPSTHPDAPSASASPLVGPTSQLGSLFLSPSSSTVGSSPHRSVGLSGVWTGGGGSGGALGACSSSCKVGRPRFSSTAIDRACAGACSLSPSIGAFRRVPPLSPSTCTTPCPSSALPSTVASASSCAVLPSRSTPISPPGSTWTPVGTSDGEGKGG